MVRWLNIARYQPLRGGSYIALPKKNFEISKAIINVQNKDDDCLRWPNAENRQKHMPALWVN